MEIIINPGSDKVNNVSTAAINCKFVYEDGQYHQVSPESDHNNAWIFIIDKKSLNEFLLPVKKGKTHFNMNLRSYNESLTVEAFLLKLANNL